MVLIFQDVIKRLEKYGRKTLSVPITAIATVKGIIFAMLIHATFDQPDRFSESILQDFPGLLEPPENLQPVPIMAIG